MTTHDRDVIELADERVRAYRADRRAELAADLADLKLRYIRDFGEDHADGTVVAFVKSHDLTPGKFSALPARYRYAAIRAAGRWYVTGGRAFPNQGCAWDEFVEWLVSGGAVDPGKDFTVLREGDVLLGPSATLEVTASADATGATDVNDLLPTWDPLPELDVADQPGTRPKLLHPGSAAGSPDVFIQPQVRRGGIRYPVPDVKNPGQYTFTDTEELRRD